MITLIYHSEEQSPLFENQMRESSGVDEVQCLCIEGDNLAKCFNEALKSSSNDIVIFLRKGVRICSQGWGKKVIEAFASSSYGIIGTLGTLIVPMSGMLWEKEEPLCGSIWYEEYSDDCRNLFGEEFMERYWM